MGDDSLKIGEILLHEGRSSHEHCLTKRGPFTWFILRYLPVIPQSLEHTEPLCSTEKLL